jgi:hypothetical protein
VVSCRRCVEERGVRFSIRPDMVAAVSQGSHGRKGSKERDGHYLLFIGKGTLALRGFGMTTLEGEGSVTATRCRVEVGFWGRPSVKEVV